MMSSSSLLSASTPPWWYWSWRTAPAVSGGQTCSQWTWHHRVMPQTQMLSCKKFQRVHYKIVAILRTFWLARLPIDFWTVSCSVVLSGKSVSATCFPMSWPFHSQEWSISNFSCSLTRNITSHSAQYEELGFSSLTQMKDYSTTNSHYIT